MNEEIKEPKKKKGFSKKKKILIGIGVFVLIVFLLNGLSNKEIKASQDPFDYLSKEDRDRFDLMKELCRNASYQAITESTEKLVFDKCYTPHYNKYLKIGTENMKKELEK